MKKSNLILALIILPLLFVSCLVEPPKELTGYDVVKKASYTVIHLQQNINGSGYTEYEREILEGAINSDTAAVAKEYTGFTVVPFKQASVSETGNTIIQIKYDRIKYTVTLDANGGTFKDGSEKKIYTIRYGKIPEFEIPVYENKKITGWIWNNQTVQQLPVNIISENQGTYKAVWVDDENNSPETPPSEDDDSGDTPQDGPSQNPETDPSSGSGSNTGNDNDDEVAVYKILIKRNNGTPDTPYSFPEGSAFPDLEEPVKEGYSFAGWEPALPATVTENATYEAKWNIASTVTMVSITVEDIEEFNITYKQKGNIFTFSATEGFDNYRWFINGTEVSEHSADMTVNTISMNVGMYEIFVIAEKDRKSYPVSAEIVFKIE